jgi:hypothetical protein
MNLSLRDENPASYRLSYDMVQNVQYVFVLLSIAGIKKNPRTSFTLLQSPQFCSKCVIITGVKMHPHSTQTATIMAHTMAENIKQPEY